MDRACPISRAEALCFPEILLEGRAELHVVCIVEKQIQLNLHVAGPRDHRGIERVTFRRDDFAVRCHLHFAQTEDIGSTG